MDVKGFNSYRMLKFENNTYPELLNTNYSHIGCRIIIILYTYLYPQKSYINIL